MADRYGRDEDLLNSLPETAPGKVEAYLTWNEQSTTATGTIETLRYWRFLYPIQQLEIQTLINTATSATIGTNSQDLYWLSNQPQTLTLPGLLLNTFWDKKSIRPILEGIDALCRASESRRSPPVLTFTCGNIKFSPCILTGDLTYRISGFLGPEPVEAELNLTLTKVDPGQLIEATAPPIPTAPPLIVLPSLTIPTPAPSPSPTLPGGTTPTAPSFTGDVKAGVVYVHTAGCTGFVVANQGADCIIATAGHCVKGQSIGVTIDGKQYSCPVIDQSPSGALDVAIARAKGYNHSTVLRLRESTSDLKKGDPVFVWGHPGGDNNLEYGTGTIVSNPLGEGESRWHDGTPGAYIRYSPKFLAPGDSGGPQFLTSTNEVITVTHGGASPKGQSSPTTKREDIAYGQADNKPTGSKIENVIAMLKKASIPYNVQP